MICEASDDELDLNEDYSHKTFRVNIHGKKKVETSILQDIEKIQWTCTKETFNSYIKLLEKKYSSNSSFSKKMLSSIRDFFSYF